MDLLDTHLDLLYTDIPSKYFACLHNVFKASPRHLQDMSSRRLQDMSSRRLQDMSSRRLQNVFSVTIFRLPRRLGRRKIVTLKTFWRRLEDMSWRRLEDISWRRLEDMSWRCLGDALKTLWRQAKYLLGISVYNKSKCVSNKSIFNKSTFGNSKANPECIT